MLDGHSSHKGLEVLEFAKEHGIILFCLPPHCTHRLQPLDICVYGPLTVYYDQEIAKWLKANPGRVVTHTQVAYLFGNAYKKAATVDNALNGFRKAGIQPFDPDVFPEWMFCPAEATNYDTTTDENHHSANDGGIIQVDMPIPTTKPQSHKLDTQASKDADEDSTPITNQSVENIQKLNVSITDLSPIPVAAPPADGKRKPRKRGATGVINSTPDIIVAKCLEAEKSAKQVRKSARTIKKRVFEVENEESGSDMELEDINDDSDAACIFCNELYSKSKPGEFWLRCQMCSNWSHCECAGVNRNTKTYVCDLCN